MNSYAVYPIPGKIHGPPYLELLYGEVAGDDGEGAEFKIRAFGWQKLLFGKLPKEERHIVHIHWPTNIYGSKYAVVSIIRILARFPALWIMKLRGVKIVWTWHNMHSHDYPHPWIDDLGQFLTYHTADKVVIQEKTFAASERARRRTGKIAAVPPGNYIGVYGPVWEGDRDKLRKKFGVKKNEIVLLAIGSIRPYKALPQIIESVRRAKAKGAHIRLLIAGKASPEYAKVIDDKIGSDKAITMYSEYIPDERIPEFLAMTDYTIGYYSETALGSAAIMLSLSYGTPVITRDFPASELVTRGLGGFIFHDDEELVGTLTTLRYPEVDKDVVIGTVKSQDWKSAGKRLRNVYKKLWSNK
ncbi:glycosyltransferase family 4 protein [Candidatus Parcubacteria bacterium]|nr:glycosyltransferase family 4 protein [Candidatus Parcubacteria bacterium]